MFFCSAPLTCAVHVSGVVAVTQQHYLSSEEVAEEVSNAIDWLAYNNPANRARLKAAGAQRVLEAIVAVPSYKRKIGGWWTNDALNKLK